LLSPPPGGRALSPFPTRRSSDLSTTASSNPKIAAMVDSCSSQAFCMALALLLTSFKPSSKLKEPAATRAESSPNEWPATTSGERSEEHTSELQSRVELVCRLLLE